MVPRLHVSQSSIMISYGSSNALSTCLSSARVLSKCLFSVLAVIPPRHTATRTLCTSLTKARWWSHCVSQVTCSSRLLHRTAWRKKLPAWWPSTPPTHPNKCVCFLQNRGRDGEWLYQTVCRTFPLCRLVTAAHRRPILWGARGCWTCLAARPDLPVLHFSPPTGREQQVWPQTRPSHQGRCARRLACARRVCLGCYLWPRQTRWATRRGRRRPASMVSAVTVSSFSDILALNSV